MYGIPTNLNPKRNTLKSMITFIKGLTILNVFTFFIISLAIQIFNTSVSADQSRFTVSQRASKLTNIKILTWWDYFDPRILGKLKNSNYDVNLVEYYSNEAGLSRLASHKEDYNIAIISNTVYQAIKDADIVDTVALNETLDTRKNEYLKKIRTNGACVPFLWGTVIFTYDSRIIKEVPKDLFELNALKKKGISVKVLDDQFEMAARISLDNQTSADPLKVKLNLKKYLFYKPEDFVSTINEIIKKGNFISYGWQGAGAEDFDKHPWVELAAYPKNPVFGIDYVCMLNNKRNKKMKSEVIKFIEQLTDKESLGWNVERTQYFSPYQNHTEGLKPKVKSLFDQVEKITLDSHPYFLDLPSKQNVKVINDWWKQVRYGK